MRSKESETITIIREAVRRQVRARKDGRKPTLVVGRKNDEGGVNSRSGFGRSTREFLQFLCECAIHEPVQEGQS